MICFHKMCLQIADWPCENISKKFLLREIKNQRYNIKNSCYLIRKFQLPTSMP